MVPTFCFLSSVRPSLQRLGQSDHQCPQPSWHYLIITNFVLVYAAGKLLLLPQMLNKLHMLGADGLVANVISILKTSLMCFWCNIKSICHVNDLLHVLHLSPRTCFNYWDKWVICINTKPGKPNNIDPHRKVFTSDEKTCAHWLIIEKMSEKLSDIMLLMFLPPKKCWELFPDLITAVKRHLVTR